MRKFSRFVMAARNRSPLPLLYNAAITHMLLIKFIRDVTMPEYCVCNLKVLIFHDVMRALLCTRFTPPTSS